MWGVIEGFGKLAGAGIEELQFLGPQHTSGYAAHPERGGRVETHGFLLEPSLEAWVGIYDVQGFLQVICQGVWIAIIALALEQVVTVVLAERCAVDEQYLIAGNLTQHFHQNAGLFIGCLADADVTRVDEFGVRFGATLLQQPFIPCERDEFAYFPLEFLCFHIMSSD